MRDGQAVAQEQAARELEHVVGVAGLGRRLARGAGRSARRGRSARPRCGRRSRRSGASATWLQKRLRHPAVARVTGELAIALGADRLGDLGVRVQAVERVLAARERVEHDAVVEEPGEPQVLGVPRDAVEVRQRLLHPAELGLQHLLPLRVGEPLRAQAHPGGHALRRLERLRVAEHAVHVEQPRQDLVQRVVRRPDALPGLDPVEELLRERRQVPGVRAARRERQLHLPQLRGDRQGATPEPLVAGRLPGERARGQVVAEAVPAQLDLRSFPAPVRFGTRRQPGIDAEGVKQPVGVEAQQVGEPPPLHVQERSVEQAHVAEREGLEPRDDGGRCGLRGGRRGRRVGRDQAGGEQGDGEVHAAIIVLRARPAPRPAASRCRFGSRCAARGRSGRRTRATGPGSPRPGFPGPGRHRRPPRADR